MGRTASAERAGGEDVVRTPQLVITRSVEPTVITLIGQVDETNLGLLESALAEAPTEEAAGFEVDLSGLSFCSVSGLRVFAQAVESGAARLTGATAPLRRAFDAAGFGAILDKPG